MRSELKLLLFPALTLLGGLTAVGFVQAAPVAGTAPVGTTPAKPAVAPRSTTVPATVATAELISELKAAPRSNIAREQKLIALFRQAGARSQDFRLQRVWPLKSRRTDPALNNITVTKPGATSGIILVGAHFDKVQPGSGVVDNWSGAAMVANLYQSLRTVKTRHTFQFVGFAYEEQGRLGSRDFLVPLTGTERRRIKAMVNLECLGVDGPFLWTNGSTDALEAFAHRVAATNKLTLLDHEIRGVESDSTSFARYGIPVITFDGLASENFGLIHSERDQFSAIKPDRYANTYKLLTRFLLALDAR
jgi:hypothetical protein